MATAPKDAKYQEPLLHNGDRMTQEEFHRAYSAMPENYRAELIGGIVFEPSPLGYAHGSRDARLATLLDLYTFDTPGIEAASNATVQMSDEDEVQPDVFLRIIDEIGGRSHLKDKYIAGAPELVAEVAHSSRAIDLHLKKKRYALAGVIEYIVFCLDPLELYWFNLPDDRSLHADEDGIFRSAVFPGLWIDRDGLIAKDGNKTKRALEQGLKSPEHKAFVAKLAAARKR